MPRPRYKGVLAKPYYLAEPIVGLLTRDEDIPRLWEKAAEKNREAAAVRLVALCKHYKIDYREEGAGWRLVLALADAHVPGFKALKGDGRSSGAPKKWTPDRYMALYAAVSAKVASGLSVSRACALLSEQPEFKGNSAGTLERRYHKALTDSGMIGKLLARSKAQGAPIEDWVIKHWPPAAGKPAR